MLSLQRDTEKNQYPPAFYEPIIKQSLENVLEKTQKPHEMERGELRKEDNKCDTVPKKMIFLQYRGHVTEDYCRSLMKCNAPCTPVLTLRKLKTILPSLKASIEKKLRSDLVYKIDCTHCQACYIGQTNQYLVDRFHQHPKPSQHVGKHVSSCGVHKQMCIEDVEILAQSSRDT